MIGAFFLLALVGAVAIAASATKTASNVAAAGNAAAGTATMANPNQIDMLLANSPVLQPQPAIGQYVSVYLVSPSPSIMPNLPLILAVRAIAGATVTAQSDATSLQGVKNAFTAARMPIPAQVASIPVGGFVQFSAPKIWGLGGMAAG